MTSRAYSLVVHLVSTKTSVLGVPSCLQTLLMAHMLLVCLTALVALTRTDLQDLQDPGVP